MKKSGNPHRRDGFIETARGEGRSVSLKGAWTIFHVKDIENDIKDFQKKRKDSSAVIRADSIEKLDTAGAELIRKYFLTNPLRLTDRQKKIFEFIDLKKEKIPRKDRQKNRIVRFFVSIGKNTHKAADFLYGILSFMGQISVRLIRNFANFRHFRFPSIVRHIHETGFEALPIIGMMALGMSTVVSYQAAIQLQKFGADLFTIDLTVISLLREMAVLVTAIMLAGRSGSAFAAEIGVMKLRGEVDALRVMGLDPVETLVVPRVLALLITLPLLTFFADIVGLAGGGLISATLLNISWIQYIDRVQSVATTTMFFIGMIKAPVFALLISCICTYQGMSVSGSAESVGKLTTLAVVQSIFVVLMVDALFSIVFSEMEI